MAHPLKLEVPAAERLSPTTPTGIIIGFEPDPDGLLVTWAEHQEIVAAMQSRINELMEMVRRLQVYHHDHEPVAQASDFTRKETTHGA